MLLDPWVVFRSRPSNGRDAATIAPAIPATGRADPLLNRGTAFTREQRAQPGVEGLLPPRVESLSEQSDRVAASLRSKATALDKYLCLAALQGDNETLFHRVLLDNLEELLPVVYTPTVGQACLEWSRIYGRPRGLYLSLEHRGRIAQLLSNWPRRDVGITVATAGGRILGLGDLGANGMGIPIGKLVLGTACAGLRPELCLPVTLDVGTDNEALRNDPRYLGTRAPRVTGDAWGAFVAEFVAATQAVFPGSILQFEDFNNAAAFTLLERHRDRLCCFNDDIQGTGAMGLAGLLAAGRITGRALVQQRILFASAGEACLGIGGLVVAALQREGVTDAEARSRCLFVDSRGLVVTGRSDLSAQKRRFAQDRPPAPGLLAAVEHGTQRGDDLPGDPQPSRPLRIPSERSDGAPYRRLHHVGGDRRHQRHQLDVPDRPRAEPARAGAREEDRAGRRRLGAGVHRLRAAGPAAARHAAARLLAVSTRGQGQRQGAGLGCRGARAARPDERARSPSTSRATHR